MNGRCSCQLFWQMSVGTILHSFRYAHYTSFADDYNSPCSACPWILEKEERCEGWRNTFYLITEYKIFRFESKWSINQAIDNSHQMLFLTYEEMKVDLPKVIILNMIDFWWCEETEDLKCFKLISGDWKSGWLSGQKHHCWRGFWK